LKKVPERKVTKLAKGDHEKLFERTEKSTSNRRCTTKKAATGKQMLQKERSKSRKSKYVKTVDASTIDVEYLIASLVI
jgi:hypothetical protein